MGEAPKSGDIWDYPYLWAWQRSRGETEGRKDRPVAVAVAMPKHDGKTEVYFLAITSKAPPRERPTLEIPEIEKQRGGLARDLRLWIVLDEYNYDIPEDSYYLDLSLRKGRLGDTFLRQVQQRFREAVASGSATGINRRDD